MTSFGAEGLSKVSTEDLKKALRAVHREDLPCPMDVQGLALCGLQHVAQVFTGHLRGLDTRAVRAVLTAVLAERQGP